MVEAVLDEITARHHDLEHELDRQILPWS